MTVAQPQSLGRRGLIPHCALYGSISSRNPIEPMMMIADEAEEKGKRRSSGSAGFSGMGQGFHLFFLLLPHARMLDASRLDDSI